MKKIVSFFAVLSIAFSQINYVEASDMKKIFVDGKTEATGDGSIEKPFKTFEEAKSEIRNFKKNGEYPTGGIKVLVRGGNYYFPNGFELSEEDSGETNAPVEWTSYPGENVKLIGGAEVKFQDCEPLTDSAIISRLDSAAADKIYRLNLKEKGIEPYDALCCFGHANYYARTYGITDKEEELVTPEIFWFGENVHTILVFLICQTSLRLRGIELCMVYKG